MLARDRYGSSCSSQIGPNVSFHSAASRLGRLRRSPLTNWGQACKLQFSNLGFAKELQFARLTPSSIGARSRSIRLERLITNRAERQLSAASRLGRLRRPGLS